MSRATPYNQGYVDAELRIIGSEDMPLSGITELLMYLRGVCDGAKEQWNKSHPTEPPITHIGTVMRKRNPPKTRKADLTLTGNAK